MTHCGRSGMSDYIRMVHIKNEHSCHGHYSHGCSNIWSHCCGGGTSFMGGVGAGLAYSLVNWAMSGLSNWFGGMGFGGMGWGNVGFGGGNYGFWGLNGLNGADGTRTKGDDYYSRRFGSSDRTSGSEGANGAENYGNKDTATLRAFNDRLDAFLTAALKGETVNNDSIDDLIDDIKAKIRKQDDDIQNDDDIVNYRKALNEAENLQKGKLPGVDPNIAAIKNGQFIIKIGDVIINSINDLANVGIDKINNLDEKSAQAILIKLGYLSKDAFSTKHQIKPTGDKTTDYLCGKMSSNGRIMKLLEKANVAVEVVKGSSDDRIDNWVTGLVSNVELNDDGTVKSFVVDCKNAGEEGYRGKYTITKNENGSYKLELHADCTNLKVTDGNNLTLTELIGLMGDLKISKK